MRRREFRKDSDTPKANGMFIAPKVQRKLKIGESNDKYEQEADHVANQVVSHTNSDRVQKKGTEDEIQQKPLANQITPLVQRTATSEEEPLQKAAAEDEAQKKNEEEPIQKAEEEEPVQKMEEEEAVQKMSEEEPVQKAEQEESVQKVEEKDLSNNIQKKEDDEVQTKELQQAPSKTNNTTFESRLNSKKGNGNPLDSSTKSRMEGAFGTTFNNVNIHTDSEAASMSSDINAQAFAHGQDVFFNKGKYNPGTPEGDMLLAHELTHTIQQNGAESESKGSETQLEQDANKSSLGLLQRLLTGAKTLGGNILPRLKSGLRVSKCDGKSKSSVEVGELENLGVVPDSAKTEDSQPKLSPLEQWQKDNGPKVKDVKSLKLETLEAQKADAQAGLTSRKEKRIADIDKEIKKTEEYLAPLKTKPKQYTDKLTALKADKIKTDEQLKKTPDSEYVHSDRRLKVIEAMDSVKAMEKLIKTATENWHKYDSEFTGSEELMKTLQEIKITPAELKALVGQESGDLDLTDEKINDGPSIYGIAQIKKNTASEVGGTVADLKDPKKTLLIAAKVLKRQNEIAGLKPDDFSNQKDYKSMTFAAYNAGGGAIAKARAKATEMKRSTTNWSELIKGDAKSPLYLTLTDASTKFKEVTSYVSRIFQRLGQ